MTRKDIFELEDIKLLVDSFYTKVRNDELLNPIFDRIIQDRWPAHLEKMYTFWQTLLLPEHTYFGSPFVPHASMPIDGEHFERWLLLFSETVDEHFEGEKADEAKWRANRMADNFQCKLDLVRNYPNSALM